MVTRGEERINWEIGIDIYTLLYIKWASRCLIGKESACQADVGQIPVSGRSPGGGNGNPFWNS